MLEAAAVLWLAALVVMYSDAGIGLPAVFLLTLGAAALVAVWAARMAIFVARERRSGRPLPRRWTIVPIAVGAAAALAVWFEPPGNVLFRWRFRLSERQLTEAAREVLRSKIDGQSPARRIALFSIRRIETHDGQVRFITTACGVVDACGLVYSPDREPTRWMEDRFAHLHGPWWHVYEGF